MVVSDAPLPCSSPVLSGGMYTTNAATVAENSSDQLSVLLRTPCRVKFPWLSIAGPNQGCTLQAAGAICGTKRMES